MVTKKRTKGVYGSFVYFTSFDIVNLNHALLVQAM
jgi:hypothetical protein